MEWFIRRMRAARSRFQPGGRPIIAHGVSVGQVRSTTSSALRGRASEVVSPRVCSGMRENSARITDRPNSHEFGDRRASSVFCTSEALARPGRHSRCVTRKRHEKRPRRCRPCAGLGG